MHYGYALRLYAGDEKFFGPGVAELLENVERHGSLREAAGSMKMAYSKAWRIIRRAETVLGFALLASKTGGAGGGGASLTAQGKDFLRRYRAFAAELDTQAQQLFEQFFAAEAAPSPKSAE